MQNDAVPAEMSTMGAVRYRESMLCATEFEDPASVVQLIAYLVMSRFHH